MMRNLFINQKRSEKRAREYSERIKMDGMSVERPRQFDRLLLSELSGAIDQLGNSERQAIRLLAVLNYSYEDAAAQTQLPIGTLKSRLSAAAAGCATCSKERTPVPAEAAATSASLRTSLKLNYRWSHRAGVGDSLRRLLSLCSAAA